VWGDRLPPTVPDTEQMSKLIFADGGKMDVRATVEEINQRLQTASSPHIPLIALVDSKGRDVWINANHIREIHEQEDLGRPTLSGP
jgi:uncharacterized protein YlzI (FlbEa/FlbD family)